MNSINDILKYKNIVEVITKHDKNTRIQTYSIRLGYYRFSDFPNLLVLRKLI